MKGLYFYKLVSPYQEDITKDCKLTINEIDHNFITLKNTDVTDINFDNESGVLTLNLLNGDKYATKIDLSHFTRDFDVKWDKENTSLIFTFDGKEIVIDELVTALLEKSLEEIVNEILSQTMTDHTILGVGVNKDPLRLNPLEIPGTYKAVECVINKIAGEELPKEDTLKKGDRFLSYEKLNHYGYLYDYESVKKINEDLKGGWRVPTKKDWDGMLNAIETCDIYRNHSEIYSNTDYGKNAGKFLRLKDYWKKNDSFVTDECEPNANPNSTDGIDAYGFSIYPAGYCDDYGIYNHMGEHSEFWTSTELNSTDVYVKRFSYDKTTVRQIAEERKVSCSLRLVKDYNGDNYVGVENIDGICYQTLLMPSENSKYGHAIWLGANFASFDKKYNPIIPNNGDLLIDATAYYIYEWDGLRWLIKRLINGDSLIIKNCPNGKKNHEHQLINDVLVDVKEDLHKELESIVYNLTFDTVGKSGEYVSTVGQKHGLISATTKTLVDENDNLLSYSDDGVKSKINVAEYEGNKEEGIKKIYKVLDKNDEIIGAPIVIDECKTNETYVSEDVRVVGGPLAPLYENTTKLIESGTNLQELLVSLFTKEKWPLKLSFNEGSLDVQINKPHFTVYDSNDNSIIIENNGVVEVGTLLGISDITCDETMLTVNESTWSGFEYGYSLENNNKVYGEGNPDKPFISEAKQESNYVLERIVKTFSNTKRNVEENENNTNLLIPSLNSFTVMSGENKIIANVSGASFSTEFTLDNVKYYACSNLGNTSEFHTIVGYNHNVISEKPINYKIHIVNGVRYSFFGAFEDMQFTVSSENIREKLTRYEYTANETKSIKAEKGKKCVVLAYPANWGKLKDICDNKALGASILNEFEISECDVNGNNNYEPINYYVYIYKTKNVKLQEIDYTIKF